MPRSILSQVWAFKPPAVLGPRGLPGMHPPPRCAGRRLPGGAVSRRLRPAGTGTQVQTMVGTGPPLGEPPCVGGAGGEGGRLSAGGCGCARPHAAHSPVAAGDRSCGPDRQGSGIYRQRHVLRSPVAVPRGWAGRDRQIDSASGVETRLASLSKGSITTSGSRGCAGR
jgi:hypothetical protein